MKKIISVLLILLLITALFPLTAFAEFENTHKNTGDYATDLTEVAITQISFADAESSKYGEGNNTSLLFLRWCAVEARIPREVIPVTETVNELYDFYAEALMLNSNPEHIPQKGDIMFIGKDSVPEQCAIVLYADAEFVTAVICEEGNSVRKKLYTIGIEKIIGYATPDYSYVSAYTTGKHMTTASFLNFRSEPNTECDVIAKIPIGTIVDIKDIYDGWGSIEYNGKKGWISLDYVVVYDENHTDSSKYGVIWNVIDVSKWQGEINWSKVAEGNLNAVILRIGLRGSKTREILLDEKFLEYYQGAKEQGLHVGCYFYSTAKNDDDAIEEARFVIDTIKKYNLEFDMPVYMDMEDPVTQRCGQTAIFSMTYAFLNEMEKANIYSGVYCSTSWATDYYNQALFSNHALWIADWHDKCGYEGEYGMWQYSEKGSISGVESKYTDLNICYINYPQLIADGGYNILKDEPEPEFLLGDINADGKITAADARTALRIAANLHTPTENERKAADINNDLKITAADARKILRISANLE